MKSIIMTLLLFYNLCSFSQVMYYQDIFRGGVCVVGSASADAQNNVTLPIQISNNGNIKKIFLVSYALLGKDYSVNDYQFQINNIPIVVSKNTGYNLIVPSNLNPPEYIGNRTNITDVTSLFPNLNNSISINWLTIQEPPLNCPSCRYSAPVIIILYEDLNLDLINFAIVLNNKSNDNEIILNINDLNPADLSKDIAIGVHSDRLSGSSTDGYKVKINNFNVGFLQGTDSPSIGAGVIGCFNYENGVLTGLTDDVSNDIFNGTDGILKLNQYINSMTDNLNIKVDYYQNTSLAHNYLIGFNLAYSTPCQPFNATVPSDTTICANSPLQLLATGGTSTGTLPAYEWQPATGLSCTDCPNPVFTSDSSLFYTVRIRSNDSCSVVRPLKINVRPQPVFSEILTTKSECFGSTGSITATSQVQGASYSLDGGAVQSSGFFENLAAGDYLLTLHDVNGCTKDTLITIEDTLTVSAQFAVNPSSGAAPLTVQITNQSQHATDYEWFLNGASQGNSFPSYTFDTSGVYEIMLHAWQNNPSCIDSFSISIQVYDSLMVEIPNVFTPNNDGINEVFGVTVNIPAEVKYRIFNRWGNEMKAGSVLTTPGVFIEIWNGASAGSIEASEGVYFYQLEVRDLSMSSPSVPLPKGEEIYVNFNGFFELRK